MNRKDKQINLRVSKKERDLIRSKSLELNYSSVAEYIINASLNKIDYSARDNKTIYTLTLNPAIDYIISTENKLQEITNFNPNEKVYEAGGKGINASLILEEHGIKNTAIHYSGGFTGELITNQLNDKGVNNLQIKANDDTRINLKLNFADDNFEINSTAPILTSNARQEILKKISHFNEDDVLMIMGSFNPVDEDFLFEISEMAVSKNVELVFDISKPVLKDLMKYKPLIIKPNKEELEEIFNIKIKNKEMIIDAMKQLRKLGAKNVAITMGKDGAYIMNSKSEIFKATIEPIKLVSPQGSGDSFISTFVAKYELGTLEAFRWANAAGAATAQVKGIASQELIEKTLNKVKVTSV